MTSLQVSESIKPDSIKFKQYQKMAEQMVIDNNRMSRVMRFVKSDEFGKNELKVTDKFENEFGLKIRDRVIFQLPNGQKFDVHYNKEKQTFTNVGKLYSEVRMSSELILVLCYKGDDKFLIHVFNDGFTEYEYQTVRNNASATIYTQDGINGVGWNFLSLSIGNIKSDFGLIIPSRFIKWFGKKIPKSIIIVLENGEEIQGSFSKSERKIYGLLPLFRKQYVKLFDILMFTYNGKERFEVCVFDRTKFERKFEQLSISTGSEEESTDDNSEEEELVEVMNDIDACFAVGLINSNIDNSSHGVYIPRNITPTNRNWKRGEKLTLQTNRGPWTVGLILSKGMARFSAGWNTFVKENEINLQNTLHFTAMGENEGIWMFEVEIRYTLNCT